MAEIVKTHPVKVRAPLDDRIYYTIVYIILGLLLLITLYPLIYILSASFSSAQAARSALIGRGYCAKSSLGPNCVGLTKIDTTTSAQSALAARISER